jgi:HK97 family phage portal protein
MSLITRLANRLGFERRADGDNYWTNFATLRSAGAVNPESAQSVAACYAAVSVLSESIGSLPLHLYRRIGQDREKAIDHSLYGVLHHAPNDYQSAVELREWLTSCTLLYGNGYARIDRGSDGQVKALHPLMPTSVQVLRKGDVIGGYEVTNRDGVMTRYLPSEIFHLRHRAGADPLIGVSPIQASRAAIELAMAEAGHGITTFQNGTKLSGVLKMAGKLTADQKAGLAASWNSQHAGSGNYGRTAILESGVEFQPLQMSLEDADFVASRRFSVEEVARIFKVPPILLGDLSHANYSNSVAMGQWYVTHSLGRIMAAWEQAISRQLLTPAGARVYFAQHSADAFLRADSAGRAAFYKSGVETGWLLKSEVRRLEDLREIQGIDDVVNLPA